MVEGFGSGEVVLSGELAASQVFFEVLKASVDAFDDVLAGVSLGKSGSEFRNRYADVLPRFEAARANSAQRGEIARKLAQFSASKISWKYGDKELPLAEYLVEPAAPYELAVRALDGDGTLRPSLKFDGEVLGGEKLVRFAEGLVRDGSASEGVVDGISWIVMHAGAGGLDLRGRRIVVLGANAELAPIRVLLEGGADVLWIDLQPPAEEILRAGGLSGTLHWVPDGADLLTQPNRVRATIREFAADGAVDIGLYAYAPGHAREWRLTAAMNAIVVALPPESVRTITMLISPTTCGVLSDSDVRGEASRVRDQPTWQGFLKRIGALGGGSGHERVGHTCANRGIVPIQGTSYAAAQYLGKLIAAEAWATTEPARHVSANTAGVSRTVSVSHPVFDTAFAGARAFGVETYDPTTTATLNGLLAIRDWLDPVSPALPSSHQTTTDRVRALTSTRIHGGIYQLPYPLDKALRVASAIGVAKNPRRVGPMLSRQ